jgi:hypothetical protein
MEKETIQYPEYHSPQVEVLEVEAERGFAFSTEELSWEPLG